jgi:hypothetical protein
VTHLLYSIEGLIGICEESYFPRMLGAVMIQDGYDERLRPRTIVRYIVEPKALWRPAVNQSRFGEIRSRWCGKELLSCLLRALTRACIGTQTECENSGNEACCLHGGFRSSTGSDEEW